MMLGQLAIHTQKDETGSLPYTIYKINSIWVRVHCKRQNYKTLRGKKSYDSVILDETIVVMIIVFPLVMRTTFWLQRVGCTTL